MHARFDLIEAKQILEDDIMKSLQINLFLQEFDERLLPRILRVTKGQYPGLRHADK